MKFFENFQTKNVEKRIFFPSKIKEEKVLQLFLAH